MLCLEPPRLFLPVLSIVDRNRLTSVSDSPLTMPPTCVPLLHPLSSFPLIPYLPEQTSELKVQCSSLHVSHCLCGLPPHPRPCIQPYVPTSPISRSSTLNLQRFHIHVARLYVYFCQSRKLRNIHARCIAEDNEYSKHLELWVAPSYHAVIHKAARDYHRKT